MCDDFEIIVLLIDYLVEVIGEEIGSLGGVWMMGGGFGGCVVVLLLKNFIEKVFKLVEVKYYVYI